jgi:hypothetical protein
MSIVTWPTDMRIGTADIAIEFDVQMNVMRNGAITTYGLPGARWTATIGFEGELETMQRPRIEAVIASLEGGANRLSMHHHGRPIPNGSMRGSPILNVGAVAGAKQIQLANANGTLLRGDLIGVLGQLVKVVIADATPSGGVMTVNIVPPLRNPVSIGTAVVWNKPAINWIPRTSVAGPFPYRQAQVRPGFSIDLVEAY